MSKLFRIVTASHNQDILNANLLSSPFFALPENGKLLKIITGFKNIPDAYNSFLNNPQSDIPKGAFIMFVHHDVYLQGDFLDHICWQLRLLRNENWGVLGVAGVRLENGKKKNIGHILDRGRNWGTSHGLPDEVDTLDELLLITRGDLLFDPQFDLHFYGADICMQARILGKKCFAINAYVHHNSGLPIGHRSESFKACEQRFRQKYFDHLPIVTTCSLLS